MTRFTPPSTATPVLSLPAAIADAVTWEEAFTETAPPVSLDTPTTVESPSWSA